MKLDSEGRVTERIPSKEQMARNPDGAYALYPEGMFAVFTDGPDIWIQWRERQLRLLEAHLAEWHRGFGGREFALVRDGATELKFTYQGFARYLRRPWQFLSDLLTPDDDWGLVADLPSFIHSHFKDKAKLSELLRTQGGTAQ